MTRLLHLSDTHLHAPDATTYHPEVSAAARLAEVIDHVRAYGPFDALVITGDVCDDGSDVGAREVRDLVDGLAPVIVAVPGNHDFSAPVRAAFGTPRAQVGPWLIIGIETQVEGEVAGVADELGPALDEIGDQPALLLMHHPVESRSTHAWFTLGGGEEGRERLATHTSPLVVLSGHTHEAYASRLGEAHLLGAPSTYYSIAHDGDAFELVPDRFGAAVVNLDDEIFEPSVELVILEDPESADALSFQNSPSDLDPADVTSADVTMTSEES